MLENQKIEWKKTYIHLEKYYEKETLSASLRNLRFSLYQSAVTQKSLISQWSRDKDAFPYTEQQMKRRDLISDRRLKSSAKVETQSNNSRQINSASVWSTLAVVRVWKRNLLKFSFVWFTSSPMTKRSAHTTYEVLNKPRYLLAINAELDDAMSLLYAWHTHRRGFVIY